MKVAIACDHGGFQYKEKIVELLTSQNIEYVDFGPEDESSVDYPDYAKPVAESVASGECDRGILICGTGIGMSIAANKVPGIRCALVHDVFTAQVTREHNNSNVLAMGQRVIGEGLMLLIVKTWLNAEFEGGRHQRRIDKVAALESCNG
ncbi:ribose 5-phosphate isomerase B [Macrococcus armenti]|uniref:ribose 5-phosphate isomerase B n=1 Tax=Macrococcus armenti TaxID=2875764 RepID=UPI001CC9F205|nr:ribose 5-phosphate isomerase B [Macrococcus armenti]UBH08402.1 ribose 5-phosphate isomerase B [Macrococcus armenti]UBH10689.1 ribose 5-phosphate isomerase B [Macrococcus armenti]UBH15170.1 ribose 5-phosphate isomerase B [Macrococcus armenti]UBH17531.1 ribose 5-phosphate isomerase B [Macrococcus armenti]UBH19795.1 ribose 5-phosphate isomerase B [Macrococcus armenti]